MMRSSVLLLSALCWITTHAQGGDPLEELLPRVSWSPGSLVTEGDTVMLECQVGGVGDAPAIWLKLDPHNPNSDEIISHGELVIMEDPRLSVAHHPSRHSYVLAIRGVSEEDAGRYQCRVPVSSQGAELRAAPPLTISLKSKTANSSAGRALGSAITSIWWCSCASIATLLFRLKLLLHI